MAIKKVRVEQIKPGVFIHDFDAAWLEIPFMKRSIKVTSQDMIDKILEVGIHEVFIDTQKGDDISDAPTAEEAKVESETTIKAISSVTDSLEKVPIHIEMPRAVAIRKEAETLITNTMKNIHSGKKIDHHAFDRVVDDLVSSVFNNTGAMLCLNQIRDRDHYTFQHSVSVCTLMTAFCKTMNFKPEITRQVAIGAMLHDLGKMYIPDSVLNKPGKLTEAEFETMKSHVLLAKNAFKNYDDIPLNAEHVIMQHHEKYDGSGYPFKLKGEQISNVGLMGSIVDVFDALTANRVYHDGMPSTDALRKIYEWSKYHFKRELVEHFIKFVGVYPVGSLVALSSGFAGVVMEPTLKGALKPKIRLIYNMKENRRIDPTVDIDLSDQKFAHYGDITRNVQSGTWGVNPLDFMMNGLPLAV